jgi:predicted enzyme related to lactoylglutathione lyase
MIEYPEGTPSWADLSSPDLDASALFYGALFGWEAIASEGPVEETGGYRMFTLNGTEVAGLGPTQPGAPGAWTTYVAVDDATAAKQRVEAAGGTTVMEPLTVMDAGTMAIFTDEAGGAFFAVWQANRHRGAQLVNAPGALTMNELATRDFDGAGRFYGEVFRWELEPLEVDGQVQYGFFKLGGRTVASALPMGEQFPAAMPPQWVPYFGIDGLEAGAAKAQELGGQALMEPTPVPEGRFVPIRDPHGAMFYLWEGSYDPPPGS